MKKAKLNKKKLTIFILLLLCICSMLSLGIYSYAKYNEKVSKKALVAPANFQFSSNYLKENNPSYNVYDWNDGLSIELYNSLNINKSEVDIPYVITVTNGNYTLTDGTNDIICTNNICTLLVREEKHIINVTPINADNPVIVSVASQTYDYALSATFNLQDAGINSYYSFTDKGEYCELSINTSSNDINSLIVNWNLNYIPDNTNQLMKNWSGTTGTLSLNRSTKYTFVFFKSTNASYSNIANALIESNTITLP